MPDPNHLNQRDSGQRGRASISPSHEYITQAKEPQRTPETKITPARRRKRDYLKLWSPLKRHPQLDELIDTPIDNEFANVHPKSYENPEYVSSVDTDYLKKLEQEGFSMNDFKRAENGNMSFDYTMHSNVLDRQLDVDQIDQSSQALHTSSSDECRGKGISSEDPDCHRYRYSLQSPDGSYVACLEIAMSETTSLERLDKHDGYTGDVEKSTVLHYKKEFTSPSSSLYSFSCGESLQVDKLASYASSEYQSGHDGSSHAEDEKYSDAKRELALFNSSEYPSKFDEFSHAEDEVLITNAKKELMVFPKVDGQNECDENSHVEEKILISDVDNELVAFPSSHCQNECDETSLAENKVLISDVDNELVTFPSSDCQNECQEPSHAENKILIADGENELAVFPDSDHQNECDIIPDPLIECYVVPEFVHGISDVSISKECIYGPHEVNWLIPQSSIQKFKITGKLEVDCSSGNKQRVGALVALDLLMYKLLVCNYEDEPPFTRLMVSLVRVSYWIFIVLHFICFVFIIM